MKGQEMADKYQAYIAYTERTPSLAIPGLVLSAFGWLTCGLLCIPGALMSMLSLMQRGPKAWSIVGLLVGLPGVALFFMLGLGLILGTLGITKPAIDAARQAQQQMQQKEAAKDAR